MSKTPEDDELGLANLPLMDEKAFRRAVQRGVIRTAIRAVLIYFLVINLFTLLTGLLPVSQTIDMPTVRRVQGAIIAGRPGYRMNGVGIGPGFLSRTFSTDFTVDGRPDPITVRGKMFRFARDTPFFGHVSVDAPAPSDGWALGRNVFNPNLTPPSDTAAVISRLPPSRVSAVVLFTGPRSIHEAEAIIDPATYDQASLIYGRSDLPYKVATWPVRAYSLSGIWSGIDQWAAALGRGDDGMLHALGLPSSAEMKMIVQSKLAFGVVFRDARGKDLLNLLHSPSVSSAWLGDARLDITP